MSDSGSIKLEPKHVQLILAVIAILSMLAGGSAFFFSRPSRAEVKSQIVEVKAQVKSVKTALDRRLYRMEGKIDRILERGK